MNKSNFKQIFLTLALLITAATGAWADGVTASEIDATVSAGWSSDESLIKASDLPGYNKITLEQAVTWASAPASGTVYLIYEIVADGEFKIAKFEDGNYTDSYGWSEETHYLIWEDINYGDKRYFYTTGPAASGPEVTLNADKDVATLTMPASDVNVEYTLVRDLTVGTQYYGIPTEPVIVKKGEDDKYVFVDGTPTVALLDLKNENAPILEGVTYAFEKKNAETGEFELTEADLLTDAQPGTWRIASIAKANGAYDGTVYSTEFTLIEKYDLQIKPADEFSKGKLDAVTVGGEAVTLDGDGKATTTTEPGTKVELKAKRGYVIEGVTAAKGAAENATVIWQGNVLIDWNNPKVEGAESAMSNLAYGSYDWSTVTAGTTLKIHYTLYTGKDYWNLRLGNGAWSALPGTADINLAEGSSLYSIVLTQDMLDELVANGGLVITGDYIYVTKVELVN